jgi:RNA polymerase sigma factor (TIGR02999 family)
MPGQANKPPVGAPPQLGGLDAAFQNSLYKELRRIAGAKMRFERGNHTLQPTALVHEVYMRLANENSAWMDRRRILAVAAHAMRNILVDYARARTTNKRGAGAVQVTLNEGAATTKGSIADVLAVDEALARLAEFDPRQAQVMEMHFFGGLTFEEIAEELGFSIRTIKKDWTMARAWLTNELRSNLQRRGE